MKYTIMGFNQEKLIEFKLDMIDTMILRWFIDFKDSGNMKKKIFDNEMYYWVDYSYIIKEIPIINISNKEVLGRRLKKLVESGILSSKIKKYHAGTATYYTVGVNYLQLISKSAHSTFESEAPDSKVETAHDSKVETAPDSKVETDPSINDPSINDSSIIIMTPEQDKYISILKTIKNYPLNLEKDIEHYNTLIDRYPEVDLIEMLKDWASYKLDKPLTKKCNPRSQLNTQCKLCIKWNKNIKNNTEKINNSWKGYDEIDVGF